MNTMCVQVISAPVEIISPETKIEPKRLRKQSEIAINPVWKCHPPGAFYKAKRLSSLITDVVSYGSRGSGVARDLLRLSIYIWNMPIRHFDGLVRRIRTRVRKPFKGSGPEKDPEALKRFEALIRNPRLASKPREKRYARYRKCRHIDGFSQMRVSRKLDLVIRSLQCTKCTFLRVQNLVNSKRLRPCEGFNSPQPP